MSEEEHEYEVESVIEAKVERGAGSRKSKVPKLVWKYRVRWKGFSEDDDTWEPIDSFVGSENIVTAFWERANSGGRNIEDLTQFKIGETFRPLGPPRKRQRRKSTNIDKTPEEQTTATSPRVPTPEPLSSSRTSDKRRASYAGGESTRPSKRARGQDTQGQDEGKESHSNATASSLVIPRTPDKARREQSPEIIPDSEDETARHITLRSYLSPSYSAKQTQLSARNKRHVTDKNVIDVDDTPNSFDPLFDEILAKKIPEHRARQDNPRVRVVDDPNITTHSAIPAKARAGGQSNIPSSSTVGPSSPTPKRRAKPGPGRSSVGLMRQKNTSSILTATKGGLKSVKGKYRSSDQKTHEQTGGGPGSPILVDDEHLPVLSESLPRITKPSAEELLQLAGLDEKAAESLPDFDEEDSAVQLQPLPVPHINEALTSSLQGNEPSRNDFRLDFAKHNLFPANPPADILETANVTWKQTTIFGPLTLGSDSYTNPDHSKSSRLFLTLDASVSIPVLLLNSSDSETHNLDTQMGSKGTPGKFYGMEAALTLLGTVRAGGSSASVIIDEGASIEEKEDFRHFRARLRNGDLFVAVAGIQILVFCSSGNTLLSQRLNVPPPLLNKPDTILVSKVDVENYSGYADATANADERRWDQHIASIV